MTDKLIRDFKEMAEDTHYINGELHYVTGDIRMSTAYQALIASLDKPETNNLQHYREALEKLLALIYADESHSGNWDWIKIIETALKGAKK
jgi:hypothetical protein